MKKKYLSPEYEIEEYLDEVVSTSAFAWEDEFDDPEEGFWD